MDVERVFVGACCSSSPCRAVLSRSSSPGRWGCGWGWTCRAGFANSNPVVIRRARRLVERSDRHPHARRRLAEAERLLVHQAQTEEAS